MNRILVIRGGAIGDFILTLPAIRLLREKFPRARLEILGYKQIVALAEKRFYADAARSIEYAALSRFFARDAELPVDLIEYFGSFDLIVSYLFDPDEIFRGNLKRAGVRKLLAASPKITGGESAVRQLARPLESLGFFLRDPSPLIYPNDEDRRVARKMIAPNEDSLVALHPGSGSEKKNWPMENWIALGDELRTRKTPRTRLIVIGGEADEERTARLRAIWQQVYFAVHWPLPHLAALLSGAYFVGHDSGISHLAAAAGAKCLLLFGPTDPAVWAPANLNAKVICAPNGNLSELTVATVRDAIAL